MDKLKPEDDLNKNTKNIGSSFTTGTDKIFQKSARFSFRLYVLIGASVLVVLLILSLVFHFIVKGDRAKNQIPKFTEKAQNDHEKLAHFPQEISFPHIASGSKQAPDLPETSKNKRVELLGNMSEMFSEPRKEIDDLVKATHVFSHPENKLLHARPSAEKKRFTLQISSASHSKNLQAYAKEKKLKQYHVYKTHRNGEPWFLLLVGNYSNITQAKQAIDRLPNDIKAKKPWVKPLPLRLNSEFIETALNEQKRIKK